MPDAVPIIDLDERTIREEARLAPLHALRDKHLGTDAGSPFVIEGELVLARALASEVEIEAILATPTRLDALRPRIMAMDAGRRSRLAVFRAEAGAIESIAGFHVHRGVLAVARRGALAPPSELAARAPMLILLESIANIDNMGSIFRNVAALAPNGTAIVLSPDCCDPLYRKAMRVSIGNVLHVPWTRCADDAAWRGFVEGLRTHERVALTPEPAAITLDDFAARRHAGGPSRDRAALMVGAEGPGLSAWAMNAADVRVRIPQHQDADSLNVATALAVALAGV
ncbi:MAG: RNA methyltransferase [Phycisphaerales bacterium]|nr:MAG: RNA methyltransferase [Phycisphaerales bacterium]